MNKTMMRNVRAGQIKGNRQALPRAEHAVRRSQSPNVLVTAAGFVILISFVVLYVLSPSAYSRFIDLWSFSPYRYPFLDAEYMSAQLECWRAGVNVYVTNPCDVLGRVQNLSPLWLRMAFLPSDKSWTNILGLTTDSLFLLSLMALPQPRRASDAVPVLVSLASPSLLFGLERANQDLILFAIIVVAILLLEGTTAARVAGSAAIVLAALLKVYPIVLLILLLRERPRTFLAETVGGLVVIIACIWAYRDEFLAALANIWFTDTFGFAFGATRLPDGIDEVLARLIRASGMDSTDDARWPSSDAIHFMTSVFLYCGTGAMAMGLSLSKGFASAFAQLTLRESMCLVSGAALICACFFAGVSNLYREVYFLLAMPGLFAMSRVSPSRPIAWLARLSGSLALLLMFYMPFDRLFSRVFGSIDAVWVCAELMWWWVVAVLLAVLLRYSFTSEVSRAMSKWINMCLSRGPSDGR